MLLNNILTINNKKKNISLQLALSYFCSLKWDQIDEQLGSSYHQSLCYEKLSRCRWLTALDRNRSLLPAVLNCTGKVRENVLRSPLPLPQAVTSTHESLAGQWKAESSSCSAKHASTLVTSVGLGITEQPELEGTLKECLVQPLMRKRA